MLPDRSFLIGQKLVENAKIQKFKCIILSYFQTMCLKLTLPFVFSLTFHVTKVNDRKKSRIRELVFLKMNSLPYFALYLH